VRFVASVAIVASVIGLGAVASARPTDPTSGDLRHYAATDTVEHYDTTRFRIFYTRAGTNAVPAADANSDGIPDHVAELGALYESVLDFYLGRGYLQPLSDAALSDNGGDGRFDVYLLDFAGSADGLFARQGCTGSTCSGYMLQENDFLGYAYPSATIGNRVLSSHEFFHAVQAAYSVDQDSVVAEGTAVWSTEQFDPTLSDFEGFLSGYFMLVDHSLDRPGTGPVPAFSYGAAIFFQFLGEKINKDVIRTMWEDCRRGARGVAAQTWLPALLALLPRDYATSFADAFATFATWNMFTTNRSDPTRGYAGGDNYPSEKITSATLPYEDDALRVFYASTQVLSFDPAGRTQVSVGVVPAAGLDGSSLAPLRVVVAPVKAGKVGTVTTRIASDPSAAIEVGDATQLLVTLAQTAIAGESTRGVLCIGSPDEVSACVTKNAPAGADMGTMPMSSDGGCAMASRSPGGLWLGCIFFVLLLRRRRVPDWNALASATMPTTGRFFTFVGALLPK